MEIVCEIEVDSVASLQLRICEDMVAEFTIPDMLNFHSLHHFNSQKQKPKF